MYNSKRFTLTDCDNDFKDSERTLLGRITKRRYKIISRFIRKHTWRSHCGHEWDCCGCKFAQRMEIERVTGGLKIILRESFNY